ncbi:unnamed protein product [Prunus armeniaca]|uniref:Uncharacterized protein n=1 Tax=Prunus armeniaca TaxID=36596 RepID=A0A6J5VMQ4_PRUAR|nr:unnamed protein product [Prunus armeniaca]
MGGPCFESVWTLPFGKVGEAVILIIFLEPDHWSFGSAWVWPLSGAGLLERFQVLSRVGELELGEAGFASAENNIGVEAPWAVWADLASGCLEQFFELPCSRASRRGRVIYPASGVASQFSLSFGR